jgi:two-component system, LytTR family, response regulator
MVLNAVIIDDENKAREMLKILLGKHCPSVNITGEAENSETGSMLIDTLQPDLVFLDIQMPGGSGIELLKKRDSINFDVIFVTSYDQFAIEALRLNALDYLLKPVNIEELKGAVQKALKRKEEGVRDTKNLLRFIHSEPAPGEDHYIPVHHAGAVHLVRINEIEYVKALSNYIDIITSKNTFTISKTLQEFEEMVKDKGAFVRISKSCMINIHQISLYYKTEPCIIILKNKKEFEVSRRKKTEVLEILRGFNIMASS